VTRMDGLFLCLVFGIIMFALAVIRAATKGK
jgi:hypothetical protein